MKARTKLEKRVESLHPTLPEPTDEQLLWMLKCAPSDMNDWNCVYPTISTVCEEFQVFRIFQVCVHNYESKYDNCKAESPHKTFEVEGECYQIWIDRKGKVTIMGHNMSGYVNNIRPKYHWHRGQFIKVFDENNKYRGYEYDGRMTIKQDRNEYYTSNKFYGTTDWIWHDGMSETLKRNGGESLPMNNWLARYECTDLLSKPTMEWLLKTGQIHTFTFFAHLSNNDVDLYERELKICYRHKHEITNPQLWCDYVRLLRRKGVDTKNPKYICPSNLRTEHDKLVEYFRKKDARDEEERRFKAELERAYREKHKEEVYKQKIAKFLDIRLSNDKYDIFPCPSVAEMAEEGYNMHHCVYACRYYEMDDVLILFCREKKGERVTTIDLRISTWHIKQCYAKHDKIHPDDENIRALVMDNIQVFKDALKAKTAKIIEMKPNHATTAPIAVAA